MVRKIPIDRRQTAADFQRSLIVHKKRSSILHIIFESDYAICLYVNGSVILEDRSIATGQLIGLLVAVDPPAGGTNHRVVILNNRIAQDQITLHTQLAFVNERPTA